MHECGTGRRKPTAWVGPIVAVASAVAVVIVCCCRDRLVVGSCEMEYRSRGQKYFFG